MHKNLEITIHMLSANLDEKEKLMKRQTVFMLLWNLNSSGRKQEN